MKGTISITSEGDSNTESTPNFKMSDSDQIWKLIAPGISIQAKCTNEDCIAYDERVIFNAGISNFDVFQSQAQCPMCKTVIWPKSALLFQCMWRIKSENWSGSISNNQWTAQTSIISKFDLSETYTTEYTQFMFEIKELDGNEDIDKRKGQKGEQIIIPIVPDFERNIRLGKGSFGTVWLAKFTKQQKQTKIIQVALKEIDFYSKDEKESVMKEVAIMLKLSQVVQKSAVSSSSYTHIVEPLGFFKSDDGNKAFLVMEYCSGGDMRKFIENMKQMKIQIEPKIAWQVISQIIIAIDQLHSNGIIHSDLKPENIMLSEGNKVKLADFGLSRQLQAGREYTTNHGGTLLYQAPELLKTTRTDQSSTKEKDQTSLSKIVQTTGIDIWAIGIMLFEMLAHHHPFIDNKQEGHLPTEEFIHRVVAEEPAELPAKYPISMKNLIKGMLTKDPSRRISAEAILDMEEIVEYLEEEE
ncbi:MAG: putative NEK protein kinase [Streblomastix strix]|uniref:non-specific serine/threonine protein kinase n=1 Tax=Streblomastix strix TaxID=222440 RepID=A0A5J4V3M5_9EUKA|nr:MAG: putative NEK protein kinase [Streblomastix strix]